MNPPEATAVPQPVREPAGPYLRTLGVIYDGYLWVLKSAAGIRASHAHTPSGAEADLQHMAERELSQLPLGTRHTAAVDGRATQLGAAYRGAGVLAGLLAALVLLCALAPKALGLGAEAAHQLGVLKVLLMAAVGGLLWATRALDLKRRWIACRRAAEALRYAELAQAVATATSGGSDATRSALRQQLGRVLNGGKDCQITYNRKKLQTYVRIEALSTSITYASFLAAAAAAVVYLKYDASWLLLITAYLPALVGTMHATNGFLRLPQLVAHHQEMAVFLEGMKAVVASCGDNQSALVDAAERVLQRLQHADDEWLGIAAHQDLHPI